MRSASAITCSGGSTRRPRLGESAYRRRDVSSLPKVLILGGGFAGIGAARKLKGAEVQVTLVDAHDYHTFQPMLYQVATGLVENAVVAHPLRDLFHDMPNMHVRQATVESIDREARQVSFADMQPLHYDYLVVALGAGVNFFGVEGAAEHGFPLYSLADAVRLKEHVLKRWEAADRDPALVEDGALNVVVVGGGATGVESAGALAELYRSDLDKDYPDLPFDEATITIVEAGSALLSMFKPDISEYTQRTLEQRDVVVLLGEVVESITPTRVTLKSGRVLKAHTLVWGAGLQGSPLGRMLGVELQRGARVATDPDLRLPGDPRVFAVGDIAWTTDTKTDEVLAQLGSVALQAGEKAGENIARLVSDKETEPFAYHDKGTMATIGPGAAVIQLRGGRTIKGKAAFLAWGSVHLALLATGEDRAKALIDWTWAAFTRDRSSRIVVGAGQSD
jgi:NADH dehydrogenase